VDGVAADSRAFHGFASLAAAAGASSVLLSAAALSSPSTISYKIRTFQWCLPDMKFKGQIDLVQQVC
jgi:CHAT domain-containing protein